MAAPSLDHDAASKRPAPQARHGSGSAGARLLRVESGGGCYVVTVGSKVDDDVIARILERLDGCSPGDSIIIDVSGALLQRRALRAIDRLIDRLADYMVYVTCPRLSGRRLLTHLLMTRPLVVPSVSDVIGRSGLGSPPDTTGRSDRQCRRE